MLRQQRIFISFMVSLFMFVCGASAVFAAGNGVAYDHVMESGKIRCGYASYDPALRIDPNTGDVEGILPDILDDMAQRLELEIEWAEEFSYVTGFENLKNGRVDMICTALWGWPSQARVGELIGPLYYYPLGVWVRADDDRFDNGLDAINDSKITISGVDGTFPLDAAREDFPKAKSVALPQISDYTQPLMEVVTKKADVTFMDNNIGLRFLEKNPNSIKNVGANPPFRIYGQFFMVNRGEFALQSMVERTLSIMILDGTVDRILKKYESGPGSYYRVATPYVVPDLQ